MKCNYVFFSHKGSPHEAYYRDDEGCPCSKSLWDADSSMNKLQFEKKDDIPSFVLNKVTKWLSEF